MECAGELDLHVLRVLDEVLDQALAVRPAPAVLLIGLGGLTFLDSSGLNALLQARARADHQGTLLHLAEPSRQVLRLLELTGTDRVFSFDRTDRPRPSN